MPVLPITPGTPGTGIWCATCKLPSAALVPLHTITEAGVATVGTYRQCLDCNPIEEP